MRLGFGRTLTLTLKVGLREGAYQLPLILGYPGVGKGAHRLDDGRLTEAGLNARPRVPCATVLVRLLPADTPAGSPPSYAARAYDTRLATPQAHEARTAQDRMRAELSQSKKETSFYMKQVRPRDGRDGVWRGRGEDAPSDSSRVGAGRGRQSASMTRP